jgi:hypothetical protein
VIFSLSNNCINNANNFINISEIYFYIFVPMQRLVTIFMLLTYLLFNAGISYSMHFCGDRLTSTEVFAKKQSCLCSSPKEPAHSCCKDVEVESGGNDQKVNNLFKLNVERILLSELCYPILETVQLNFRTELIAIAGNSGPPLYRVPLFILNQIFRL